MITEHDIAPFVESYVLSNTPEYLLRRFLGEPRLDSIVSQNSVDDLLADIRAADNVPREVMTEMIRGYLAVIALFKKGDERALDLLRIWTPNKLRWLAPLLATWDRLRKPTSVETRTFIQAAPPADALRSSSTTSSINIVF